MRMLGLSLVAVLLLAPASAYAGGLQCKSVPECLASVGMGHLDAKTAAILGAAASPVVIAGAFMTAAVEQSRAKEGPRGVVVTDGDDGRPRVQLKLIPSADDTSYGAPAPADSKRQPPSGAFKFNDTATNVALAVGGAAVVTSVIMGIVQSAKHH
jgi:hypothetical protein